MCQSLKIIIFTKNQQYRIIFEALSSVCTLEKCTFLDFVKPRGSWFGYRFWNFVLAKFSWLWGWGIRGTHRNPVSRLIIVWQRLYILARVWGLVLTAEWHCTVYCLVSVVLVLVLEGDLFCQASATMARAEVPLHQHIGDTWICLQSVTRISAVSRSNDYGDKLLWTP